MTTRRAFIGSLLAASSLPTLTWADAGDPAYVAAAREADGGFALFGLSAQGADVFRVPLPTRGHAAAAHPSRPEAVAFARRPGTFALVIDCVSGRVRQKLDSPEGRHFYGHGAFSADGELLFTTENHIGSGEGRIGIWSRDENYARIGEFASGGIGPHELLRLGASDTLVIANGGILTDPARGREKLNLDTMAPNLSYLSPKGELLEQVTLPPEMHQNSIRHLAQSDGLIAFAMQWEGDPAIAPPLVGLHRRGQPVILAAAPDASQRRMKGYAGSVAFSGDRTRLGITSPKGGVISLFDLDGTFVDMLVRSDVCGLGTCPDGFLATDGFGGVSTISGHVVTPTARANRAWDNHLVRL